MDLIPSAFPVLPKLVDGRSDADVFIVEERVHGRLINGIVFAEHTDRKHALQRTGTSVGFTKVFDPGDKVLHHPTLKVEDILFAPQRLTLFIGCGAQDFRCVAQPKSHLPSHKDGIVPVDCRAKRSIFIQSFDGRLGVARFSRNDICQGILVGSLAVLPEKVIKPVRAIFHCGCVRPNGVTLIHHSFISFYDITTIFALPYTIFL